MTTTTIHTTENKAFANGARGTGHGTKAGACRFAAGEDKGAQPAAPLLLTWDGSKGGAIRRGKAAAANRRAAAALIASEARRQARRRAVVFRDGTLASGARVFLPMLGVRAVRVLPAACSNWFASYERAAAGRVADLAAAAAEAAAARAALASAHAAAAAARAAAAAAREAATPENVQAARVAARQADYAARAERRAAVERSKWATSGEGVASAVHEYLTNYRTHAAALDAGDHGARRGRQALTFIGEGTEGAAAVATLNRDERQAARQAKRQARRQARQAVRSNVYVRGARSEFYIRPCEVPLNSHAVGVADLLARHAAGAAFSFMRRFQMESGRYMERGQLETFVQEGAGCYSAAFVRAIAARRGRLAVPRVLGRIFQQGHSSLCFADLLAWHRAMRQGARAFRSLIWAKGWEGVAVESADAPAFGRAAVPAAAADLQSLASAMAAGGRAAMVAGDTTSAAPASEGYGEGDRAPAGWVPRRVGLFRAVRHARECLRVFWGLSGSRKAKSALETQERALLAVVRIARGAALVDAIPAEWLGDGSAAPDVLRQVTSRLGAQVTAGDVLMTEQPEAAAGVLTVGKAARQAKRRARPVSDSPEARAARVARFAALHRGESFAALIAETRGAAAAAARRSAALVASEARQAEAARRAADRQRLAAAAALIAGE